MNLSITIVYFCGEQPPDTDNIIKPIQDALNGLIYNDDRWIQDVFGHRRPLASTFDPARLPAEIRQGLQTGGEFVFVRIGDSLDLEDLL